MDISSETSGRLTRASSIFRRLSTLCFIAFLISIVWVAFVCCMLALSIINESPDSGLLFSALPALGVYALYGTNFSFIPFVLGRMLKDISTERKPFTQKNSRRLFKLAIIMLLYAILESLLIAVDSQVLFYIGTNKIQVGSFIYDFVSHSGTSLNLFPLVIAAVFFALSYVFKYGVLLQQESDETL